MKLLRKKKKETEDAAPPKPFLAYVLLDAETYDFQAFVDKLKLRWRFNPVHYVENNKFCTVIDGMIVGIVLVPSPIADQEILPCIKPSSSWPGADVQLSRHLTHLLVTVMREKDPISSHILFTKVLSCLLEPESALGVYFKPGAYDSGYFIEHADALRESKLPVELWVHVDAKSAMSGYNFFTSGMAKFQKNEFEIVGTKRNFTEVSQDLFEIIAYTIQNNVDFHDGETIGSEENTVSVAISEGILTEGTTTKLVF